MPAHVSPNRPKDKPFRIYPEIPPDIYEKIRIRAERNLRTVRAEIVMICRDAVENEEQAKKVAL